MALLFKRGGKVETLASSKPAGAAGGIVDPKSAALAELIDVAKTVVYAVGIALFLRFFFFQPFNIPSGSMKPDLLVGDFLFVSKPAYGYSRASLIWPLTRLPLEGRVFGHKPKRGDVVVFKNRLDDNKDYIKRIIGLPGDTIEMINGHLYINDAPVKKEFYGDIPQTCGGGGKTHAYRETLDNGVSYIVAECLDDDGPLDNRGPYLVPPGRYFMMGDNRDDSEDSRVLERVGYVPYDAIVGKADRLFFSVDGAKAKLWEVWKWPFAIRYGRIFEKVE